MASPQAGTRSTVGPQLVMPVDVTFESPVEITSNDGTVTIVGPYGPFVDLSTLSSDVKYLPLAGGTMTGPIVGFEDKGGQVFNVKAYGAKCDGTTDDTSAVQAATTAAVAVGGIVYHPGGTCVLSAQIRIAGSVQFLGVGESSVYLVKAGTGSSTTFVLFGMGNALTNDWTFRDLLIDGNGANQVFTGSTSNTYFAAISASYEAGGYSAGPTLKIDNVKIQNFTMLGSSTYGQGVTIDTYGCPLVAINGFKAENCDIGLFITQAFTTTPCRMNMTNLDLHNCLVQGLYLEGTPDTGAPGGVNIDNVQIVSDTASTTNTGIYIWTENAASKIHINNVHIENVATPITVGLGADVLTDSSITNVTALNCAGAYRLNQIGPGCTLDNLTADSCGAGGLSYIVYGAFHLGYSGAPNATIVTNLICINSKSTSGAVQSYGPMQILGGSITGTNPGINLNNSGTTVTSIVRGVAGVNPIGSPTALQGTAFAISASTVAATNNTGVDGTLYTTGAGIVTAVSVNGVAVSGTLAVGDTYRLAAGGTLTLTYSTAPTLVFVGD